MESTALRHGTCTLCGQVMLYDPESNNAWHPWDVERACPPEPRTLQGWQEFNAMGFRSGRPGVKYFKEPKEEVSF